MTAKKAKQNAPKAKKNKKEIRRPLNDHPPKADVAPIAKEGGEEAMDVRGKRIRTPMLLRGMKDILPKEEDVWHAMYDRARSITAAYGYGSLETPILEEAALFTRSIGRGTDVVEKEMYAFEDRDSTKVALRPEFTASVARAYIVHGMHNLPQPVKVWLAGPLFRHDRPQAGRYREFHQFDCEVIGERDPIIDAELIVVAYNYLRDLGVDTRVDINSIGSKEDRERYIVELLGYLRTKRSYLCEDCKRRMVKNPLRVLDCKEPGCAPVLEDAPQILDWLSEGSKNYFMKVLEYLDEMNIPYLLRSTLVRGLDYYTDTVFELYAETPEAAAPSVVDGVEGKEEPAEPAVSAPAQSALGGGGRYDLLVEELGGRPTPACGFALGLERIAAAVKASDRQKNISRSPGSPIFIAQLGEQARRRTLRIIEELRRQGMVVRHNLGKPSLKAQLELANKFGATHTLIIGQKEVQDGTVIVRDMESGIQEIIDQKKVSVEVEKLLKHRKSPAGEAAKRTV